MPKNETRVIRVLTEAGLAKKDINKITKALFGVEKQAKRTNKTMSKAKAIIAGAFAGLGVRAIARSIDSFQLLEDRIKVFTGSAQVADEVFGKLTKAARYTRTSVDALATSYARVALATQELGLSQDQILGTVVGLQQTFRIAGATIAEAAAATIQLSQGLSSGQLRGQELRSVMEQNTVFAGILAEELGIARGQLIKFAENGLITSDVVLNALGKNFKSLNEQAAGLGTTFEQTLVIAFDAFRLMLRELNKEFSLTERFSKAVFFIIDNLDKFGAALLATTPIIVGFGIVWVATVLNMGKAWASFTALFAKNPLGLALVAISVTVAFLAFNWKKNVKTMYKWWLQFSVSVIKGKKWIVEALTKFLVFMGHTGKELKQAKQATEGWNNALKEKEKLLKKVKKELKGMKGPTDVFAKIMDNITKAMEEQFGAMAKALGKFAALNKAYRTGSMSLTEYNKALTELKIKELEKKMNEGKISIIDYTRKLGELNGGLDHLSTSTQVLQGFELGLIKVSETIGSIVTNTEKLVTKTFNTMEDELFSWVKEGQFGWRKLGQVIVDELTRITIRMMILKPLLDSLMAATGKVTTSTSGGTTYDFVPNQVSNLGPTVANGGVFQGGKILPFASGGVVSSPTYFPMAGGQTGLMGEAGAEAILPLTRRGGRLGVEASSPVVNIYNNSSDTQVETRQSTNANGEKQLDVLIVDKVTKAIGDGSLDRAFNQTYGLNRRGY